MVGVCPKHGLKQRHGKKRQCPECIREYAKRYSSTERAKALRQKSDKKYSSTEKGKTRAKRWQMTYNNTPEGKWYAKVRDSVGRAIDQGKLIKKPCAVCGNTKVEAHHAWGTAEEHILHVVFLCKKHHALADHNPIFNEELKSKAPVE